MTRSPRWAAASSSQRGGGSYVRTALTPAAAMAAKSAATRERLGKPCLNVP